jgi:hypothetical protein
LDNTAETTAGQARPPKPSALRVIPEAIPSQLKALPQWVVWRYSWQKGKWDKPLLQSHTGNLASHSSQKTWSDYQAAINAYLFDGANLDGIGFVFKKENSLLGIDLDDCRNPQTGDIEPWAQEIIDQFNTYTEISTSETGIHLIGEGTLPGQGVKTATVEMYDNTRYFCTTGNVLPGTPGTINPIPQERITNLYQRLRSQQARAKQRASNPSTNGTNHSPHADDDRIVEKAKTSTNGDHFISLWDGEISSYPSHSEADLALCRLLAFFTQDAAQIDRLFRQSGLMRDKWGHHPTYSDSTITLAIESARDHWRSVSAESSNGQTHAGAGDECNTSSNGDDEQEAAPTRPLIQLNTDMTGVVNKLQTAIRQLPKGPYLYQRAHQLSIIARGIKPPKWLRRPPDAPIIHPASHAYIRELAAYAADWEKFDERAQKWKATLPPPWTIDTLIARPWWTFPPLEGIICAPTLRPDGSILAEPGYDADTGLYLSIDQNTFPPIPERPTIDDARKALHQLKEVYVDFPFSAEHDKAAAVSAILSMAARFSVQGRVPLFAVRSTTRGSGKGLLIDTISMIATGRHAPRWPQTLDEEEERKRLLTVAMAGDPLIHIDNVTHPLGSAPLDMVLTAETITDRILGQHAQREAPLHAVFFASGNNMVFRGDMARRVLPIDLAPTMERPEERESFTHTPLLDWVLKQRPALVCAALTLLKAYFVAGCPKQSVKPFGSFEAWSNLIRQSLVWVDGQDPCEGRTNIEAESDPDYEQHHALLCAWYDRYQSDPKTVKAIKADIENHMVKDDETERWIIAPAWRDLHEALIALDKRGRDIDARAIGFALRSWQGRVVAGKQLIKQQNDRLGIAVWCVRAL